jgi:hypothetical protein
MLAVFGLRLEEEIAVSVIQPNLEHLLSHCFAYDSEQPQAERKASGLQRSTLLPSTILTRRGRTATFVTFLANNNALQFASGSGYRVDPIPCRGTADEAPA